MAAWPFPPSALGPFSRPGLISRMPEKGSLRRKGWAARSLENTLEPRAKCPPGLTLEDVQCPRGRLARCNRLSPRGAAGIITLLQAEECVQRAGGTLLGEGFLKLTFNFPPLKIHLQPSHSGL